MIITAKYLSTCPNCGGSIGVGDKVEWTKGSKASHAKCPKGRTAAAPKRAAGRPARERQPAFPDTAPEPGAIRIEGTRLGRNDQRYDAGATVHAPKVREAGGGPDGHYFTVIVARLFPPCEDAGHYHWTEYAWVRPATETEAAPVAARIAARTAREGLARDLGAAPAERVREPMPASAVVLVPRDGTRLCVSGERVAVVDGAILHERVGDPDMCDSVYHYVVRITDPSAELRARVEAFVAAGSAP